MPKEHYFVVVGERRDDGEIVWSIDAEHSVSPEGPEYSVWNNDTHEWESCSNNMPEDNIMFNNLRMIFENSDPGLV